MAAMSKRFNDGGAGPSQRQLKVGETIRRALSDILVRGEAHDPALAQWSITVSEVRTSPDLRHATCFVSPLGGKDPDGALSALRQNARALRHLVNKRLTTKYSPELRFVLDETYDRLDEARQLFDDSSVRRDLDPEKDQDV